MLVSPRCSLFLILLYYVYHSGIRIFASLWFQQICCKNPTDANISRFLVILAKIESVHEIFMLKSVWCKNPYSTVYYSTTKWVRSGECPALPWEKGLPLPPLPADRSHCSRGSRRTPFLNFFSITSLPRGELLLRRTRRKDMVVVRSILLQSHLPHYSSQSDFPSTCPEQWERLRVLNEQDCSKLARREGGGSTSARPTTTTTTRTGIGDA